MIGGRLLFSTTAAFCIDWRADRTVTMVPRNRRPRGRGQRRDMRPFAGRSDSAVAVRTSDVGRAETGKQWTIKLKYRYMTRNPTKYGSHHCYWVSKPVPASSLTCSAGVIGLSAALRLQEAGYSVTIVAKDFPVPFETADPHALIDYASPWAGAHNRWVLPVDDLTTRDHELAKETYIHMKQIVASNPECGIAFARGIEYLESPSAEYLALDETKARIVGMENWKRIPNAELPPKVTWGCEYDTWCANPMVYCLFLLRQFVQGGGKTVHAALKNSLDAVSRGPAAAVVNCSGTGFNDPACFPTRGM